MKSGSWIALIHDPTQPNFDVLSLVLMDATGNLFGSISPNQGVVVAARLSRFSLLMHFFVV